MPDRLKSAWIDKGAAVADAAAACAEAERFALDTEADSLHSYFHKVCLIQLTADGRHFIVDPLAFTPEELQPLWRVVEEPGTTVMMHGADYDIRVLDRDFGARIRGLQDTQIMAQLLGEAKTGLGALLEQEFGLTLDKRHQRADWGRRPLAPALLEYAAADTAYLLRLADRLRSRLEGLGRWAWAVEEFRQLEGVRFEPQERDPFAFERVKGAKALRGADRDRLYSIFEWRDRVARRRDLPPFKVLGNRPMLELATAPPGDTHTLTKLPGLGTRFARRWGREVVRVLERPRSAPQRRSGERSPRLTAEVQRRARRLGEIRDEVAAELALQPGLVCPKALIQELASGRPDMKDLERRGLVGWRLEILGESFVGSLGDL